MQDIEKQSNGHELSKTRAFCDRHLARGGCDEAWKSASHAQDTEGLQPRVENPGVAMLLDFTIFR